MAKEICCECEKVYEGGAKSFYCPECRKKKVSESAKKRNLNKIGIEARRRNLKELEGKNDVRCN